MSASFLGVLVVPVEKPPAGRIEGPASSGKIFDVFGIFEED
jgi:hypothetical protein